ncbi:LamG domain-containing protein [Aeromonas bestiarum]|nr:LamG domain-containing protein [Aeromonas bestiarum]
MKGLFIFIMVFFSFSSSSFAKEIYRYKLDGNAIDSGLGAISGNIVGNVSPTQDRNGDANKAMLFQKGMIAVDGLRNVDFGSTFSISFWMRRDWQNDYMGVIGNKAIDIRMGREGNGSFIFSNFLTDAGIVGANNMFTIKNKKWEHVVSTYDHGTVSLYINGMKVHEGKGAESNIKPMNAPLVIGTNNRLGYEPFIGALDDIWMFDHVLSESEINSIYMDSYTPTNSINVSREFDGQEVSDIGGDIRYGFVINNEPTNINENFSYWGVISMPNGGVYPISSVQSVNISPGSGYELKGGVAKIPEWFPSGVYTMKWYVADPSKPKGNLLASSIVFVKK